ncbi:MAG: hypothetical protein M1832_003067 [Thelocarpon impressellum]|nr:MAG: hypothetical protein M1832_003067 [Thelocarpon impressellum]
MASDLKSSVSTPDPGQSRPTTVCVFCGSSAGTSPTHLAAARSLAEALHRNRINLVYGGGTVGIMGEVARTLVSLSGPQAVHGIIPAPLMRLEQGGSSAPDEAIFGRTTVVADMHTRKRAMAREVMEGGPGGGFIALSGGYGTLEELMEVTTWNQLGIHALGVVVFNVDGYYDGLMQWVRNAVDSGFVSESNRGILVEAHDADKVISILRDYVVSEGRLKLTWGSQ